MSMDEVTFVVDLEAARLTEQEEAFRKALRNPVERAILVASDALQACLRAIGKLVPDMGWTPPAEPTASRS